MHNIRAIDHLDALLDSSYPILGFLFTFRFNFVNVILTVFNSFQFLLGFVNVSGLCVR